MSHVHIPWLAGACLIHMRVLHLYSVPGQTAVFIGNVRVSCLEHLARSSANVSSSRIGDLSKVVHARAMEVKAKCWDFGKVIYRVT